MKRRSRQADLRRTQDIKPAGAHTNHWLYLLLAAGIVVRAVVSAHLGYLNNDNHFEVIEHVAGSWLPARADQFNQGYHPPLYYYLAAVFYSLWGTTGLQFLSFLLSSATLMTFALTLRQLPWINRWIRLWCLALAAFHPQFMLFSLFFSNDTLAIFLGALLCYLCYRAQQQPSAQAVCLIGLCLGFGLLTKAVFLVYLLPIGIMIWRANSVNAASMRRPLTMLTVYTSIAVVFGCYKYIEQWVYFGDPLLSNLDLADWVDDQRPTWIGIQTLADFNLAKLMMNPVVSSETVHSYPLMTYASFWYAFIPESTFISNQIRPFDRLGPAIYLFAVAPTTLIIVGSYKAAANGLREVIGKLALPADLRERASYEFVLLLALLLNLLLILSIGWRYDAWSVFQGRLLFPCYFGMLILMHRGIETLYDTAAWKWMGRFGMIGLVSLFLAYFAVEIMLAQEFPPNRFATPHMNNKIDMTKY